MKVLFVVSGNNTLGISPIVINQGKSLINSGLEVVYFPIVGKGLLNYIKHVFLLKKKLLNNKYDVIHAHYSFCGFVATLANAKPLVVSLMGSDVHGGNISRLFVKVFSKLFWKFIIVKSVTIKN